MTAKLEMR